MEGFPTASHVGTVTSLGVCQTAYSGLGIRNNTVDKEVIPVFMGVKKNFLMNFIQKELSEHIAPKNLINNARFSTFPL